MDVFLEQSMNNVKLYVDDKIATIFVNKSIEQVADWTEKNLKNVKIHIAK